jgi:hypothetical protein
VASTELLDAVRADANAAIDRLVAGTSQNEKLQAALLKGNLQINPTTVALESGRSRTYFGYVGCLLPDVRQRILELKTSTGRAVAFKRLAATLQARVQELQEAIKARDSAIVALEIALIQERARNGRRSPSDAAAFREKRKRRANH